MECRIMRRLILTGVVFIGSTLCADTEIVNGIEWQYSIDGTAATVKKLVSMPKSGEVLIPSRLGGLIVKTVDSFSFLGWEGRVTSIMIPETITEIKAFAFAADYRRAIASGSASYRVYKHLPSTNFFFLGDRPKLEGAYMTVNYDRLYYSESDYVSGFYSGPNSREYEFTGKKVWFIQGKSGWNDYDYDYQGGEYSAYHEVEIDPSEGSDLIQGTQRVIELACSDGAAKIFYTVNGCEPVTNETDSCFLYRSPIVIHNKTSIKAIAFNEECPFVVTKVRSFASGRTENPSMATSAGAAFFYSGNIVSLETKTDDAVIRYTLDGSDPTSDSLLYKTPFSISETTTVKAKAFKEDWFDSEIVSETFTRLWHRVESPTVTPNNGVFENPSQQVEMSCETEDVEIWYTTDGSDPVVNGRLYKGAFDVYESCMIRAIAKRYDWKDSVETTNVLTRAEGLSEAANLYGYLMETDGTHPWTVVTDVSHDGVSCVKSGGIGNGGMTWLQTSLKKAGTVSFWWRAACEEPDPEDGEDGYYDYGAFLVDGNVAARLAGNDTGWQFFSTNITSGGKHVLRWEYSKDGATTYAPDCVWLDQVQWVPADGSGYTLTTPEPVPYAWLSGYGLGGVSDFETAAKGATGKRSGDGRALQVWQDYVAGTDPTNAASVFTAGIEIVDGVPQVIWSPNLNTNGVVRSYTIWGKESLTDAAWHSPTNAADRFFKVSVEMP